MDFLVGLDTDIFLWLNSINHPFWDLFMYASTGKWIWVPFYGAILYAIYLAYGWRTMLLMGLMTAVAVALSDQICAGVLRPIVARMRPSNINNPLSDLVHIVSDYRSGSYGFPSSHAANTFALAALTSFLFRRWKYTVFIYVWALIICYSRIYLGVHYPGDILVGLLIGSFFGTLCYFFASNILYLIAFRSKNKETLRKIIDTYKNGTPLRPATIVGKELKWSPTYIPEAVGLLTFICIMIYTWIEC